MLNLYTLSTANDKRLDCCIVILFLSQSSCVLTQLCLTLCDPMGYSLAVSAIHGIFQARMLAAKLTSVVSDSVRPHRRQPIRLPLPGIFQARTLEWVAISFSNAWKWKVKGKSLIHVQLFTTPWTATHQAPLSMGFSRQEYWSGVPLPPLGDLPDTGIEPVSLESPALTGGLFTWEA